ncbi:DUF4148 domain-containing protein [Herbaspirillum sp. HC18]|nr:DUF4148 domain-containing protein [Herbaspirillum sp. HC18]
MSDIRSPPRQDPRGVCPTEPDINRNILLGVKKMNAKQLIALVSMLAAGSVFAADNGIYVDHSNFVSTKTRAEVRAEMAQAAATGALGHESEFVEHTRIASTKSRDEVRGEAVQAARNQARQPEYYGG